MYAAPPHIQAEIFATIPEEFHISGRNSPWIEAQLHGAKTPVFLEGPAFDQHGNLWVVDIPWGRLFRVTPDGNVSCELEYDGEPNGMAFHRDGRAFITDNKNGILVFDPATGEVKPYLDRALVQRFKGVNDLTFASNGDLYFTDQGQTGLHDATGKLFRLCTDGRLDCLLANVPSPNGLVLSLDEGIVFLAVTRANAIWRVPLVRQGLVTKVGTYIQMTGGGGPDGMALDRTGGLAVCHVGMGCVWLFNHKGEPALRVNSPTGLMTTNCAYGGAGNRKLYVTEGRNILVAEMPQSGFPTYVQSGAEGAAA